MEDNVKQDVQQSAEQSPDGIDHFNVTEQVWHEVINALRDEVNEGRLVSLVFMLKDTKSDRAMCEHFGQADFTELLCRKVNEKLALAAHRSGHKVLAEAIRSGMRGGQNVQ